MPSRSVGRTALILAATALATPALAADVDFAGFYRARGRIFDSLSLDHARTDSEGMSELIQHRVWLQPRFLIDDKVSFTAEIKALDGLTWGSAPATYFDPAAAEELPLVYSDDLRPPRENGQTSVLTDITLWRAWADVTLGDQHFRFGRVPLHWGSGVWQNDGLGFNADYGDTTDRLQWEGLFDQVYASLAVDTSAAGFVGLADDTWAFNAMAAYRTEAVTAGVNLQYKRTDDNGSDGLDLYTADTAFEAELGQLSFELEAVARFGQGDLPQTGANDVRIAAGGGALQAHLDTDRIGADLLVAFATGDGNTSDNQLGTFTFDPDFNVGLILFEQPMPTPAAGVPSDANGGRSYDEVLSGTALSNAFVLKPTLRRTFGDLVQVEGSFLWARTAKLPAADSGRGNYGYELNAGARFIGVEHLDVGANLALFLPGTYYSNAPGSFSDPVFGAQLITRVRF